MRNSIQLTSTFAHYPSTNPTPDCSSPSQKIMITPRQRAPKGLPRELAVYVPPEKVLMKCHEVSKRYLPRSSGPVSSSSSSRQASGVEAAAAAAAEEKRRREVPKELLPDYRRLGVNEDGSLIDPSQQQQKRRGGGGGGRRSKTQQQNVGGGNVGGGQQPPPGELDMNQMQFSGVQLQKGLQSGVWKGVNAVKDLSGSMWQNIQPGPGGGRGLKMEDVIRGGGGGRWGWRPGGMVPRPGSLPMAV